jgi:hypothetical protein
LSNRECHAGERGHSTSTSEAEYVPVPFLESFARLYRAGWSVADVAVQGPSGLRWLVTGTNGENCIRATRRTQTEAWQKALRQAEAVGMTRAVRLPAERVLRAAEEDGGSPPA